jgi:hypothetical protein
MENVLVPTNKNKCKTKHTTLVTTIPKSNI